MHTPKYAMQTKFQLKLNYLKASDVAKAVKVELAVITLKMWTKVLKICNKNAQSQLNRKADMSSILLMNGITSGVNTLQSTNARPS